VKDTIVLAREAVIDIRVGGLSIEREIVVRNRSQRTSMESNGKLPKSTRGRSGMLTADRYSCCDL
jgi:hypothetical protein